MQNNNNINNTSSYNTDIESTRNNSNVVANMQQNPYINQNTNTVNTNTPQVNIQSGFNNGDFIKGALIGAAVTFLLTNKNAQNTIFGAISKGNELFQAGMEELKERYEDMKAQREASEDF